MEAPLAEADPTPGRRWNPWEIAPIHGVDNAGIGLLRCTGMEIPTTQDSRRRGLSHALKVRKPAHVCGRPPGWQA